MLTVIEALQLSADYLQKYNIESPRLNAELLLADILNCKRLDLYLLYDRPLNETELQKYREYLKRRIKREPLQYITGYVYFFGYKFFVNSSVLIPRPETEILVDSIINHSNKKEKLKILDIGIGSGNISVSLLKNLPNAEVVGIDITNEAISLAKKNAVENNVYSKLELKRFDILNEDYKKLGMFDIIVSNPPYVSLQDYNNLEPELKVYEPASSLTDFANGYKFYEKIIHISKELLDKSGKLYFELGKDQNKAVYNIMESNGFYNIKIIKDYSLIDRIIYGDI
ncbi:MAG: peptide chain release factor N(5)-glutamine methyltransferase [Ignavibacteriaceae bacterium]